MKKFALFGFARKFGLVLSVFLVSCGSSSTPDFSGTWDGTLADLDNNCPFLAAPNLNNLFPMTVSEDASGVITVSAANGDVAVGGHGDGETISFTATAAQFGNYGTTFPYRCETSLSKVGFLDQDDNLANVSVTIVFNNCVLVDGSDTEESCALIYRGQATKLQPAEIVASRSSFDCI